MESAVVRLTFEQVDEGSCYYHGASTRNPIYTFEVCVQPRGSSRHGIFRYGVSRVSFVALYLGTEQVVSLPRHDRSGQAHDLSPLENHILKVADGHFPCAREHPF